MAKRFTDSTKWQKKWFNELDTKYKLFWLYILDSCNHGGIWDCNIPLAEFQLNEKYEVDELKKIFNGRIRVLDEYKWFIPNFIVFQYKELNESVKVHKSVIEILKKEGLLEEIGYTGKKESFSQKQERNTTTT